MSLLSDQVLWAFRQSFPYIKIKTEYYINYSGQKLYFDFFVPGLKLLIEVNGRQHEQFVSFMHGTAYNYRSGKKRDQLKKTWAQENNYTLVSVDESEIPITKERLLEKINS